MRITLARVVEVACAVALLSAGQAFANPVAPANHHAMQIAKAAGTHPTTHGGGGGTKVTPKGTKGGGGGGTKGGTKGGGGGGTKGHPKH